MKYKKVKELLQKRVDSFPIVFAFNDEQFNKAMKKLGITDWTEENLKDKIVSIGVGGFIKKDMVEEYNNLFININKDREKFLNESEENFIDAVKYELSNYALEPALEILNLDYDKLTKRQLELVEIAKKEQ